MTAGDTLTTEQRRARLRELLLKAGTDPADIATPKGFEAACAATATLLRATFKGQAVH